MATPGIAVPGSSVPANSPVSPGGAQGIQGVQGQQGVVGPVGPLSAGFVSLNSTYTATSADAGKYFILTALAPWTFTLPAPVNGFAIQLRNDGAITSITIQPPSGTIDGASSLTLLPSQECTILCDGTNYRTFGLKRSLVVATYDITLATPNQVIQLPVGYRTFDIDILTSPSTDGAVLLGVFSTDRGSTFISTGYYDGIIYSSSSTAVAYSYASNVANNRLSPANQNIATRPSQVKLRLQPNLISGSQTLTWVSQSTGYSATLAQIVNWAGVGALYNISSGIVNAMRISYSGGNIVNGSIIVRGTV